MKAAKNAANKAANKAAWPLLMILSVSSGLLFANPNHEQRGPGHQRLALDSHQAEQMQEVIRNHQERFQPTAEERAFRQQELAAQVQQVLTVEQFEQWQEQQQHRPQRDRPDHRSARRSGRNGHTCTTQ